MHPYPDAYEAASACADHIFACLSAAIARRGQATLAVSGGSTPRLLFDDMAAGTFDWSQVHLFWVDERCVPPGHDQSNYRLAKEHLLDRIRMPQANVHRIQGEREPAEAARLYEGDLRAFFQLKDGALPRFDVIQHGMGPDAHTASLFPGEPLIRNTTDLAAAVYVEKMKSWRVTLLPGVLRGARHTVFLLAGGDKAGALRDVLGGQEDVLDFPSQLVARPEGDREIAWFVDEAAAEGA